ncbi:MAG: putative 7-carboxy-7-deazaguanine synthase QueE [Paludibacteraceae bacterium]|nr:putative 7-carboxy-7-deazaguanine synthase QueE [Paludibacteraceae bacterium]
MNSFPVIEKFVSIDGEGPTAGALSVFVRFAGCNLRCAWCDTSYAWQTEPQTEYLSAAEIAAYVQSTGVRHVTLTGGEPLMQKGLIGLLSRLSDYEIHIETNGSLPIQPLRISERIHFVVDYKLPDSGMEAHMYLPNLAAVTAADAYKFVIASQADLDKALLIIRQYRLTERCQVFLSTVFDRFAPALVVEAMARERLNGVKLQLQLHKYIWDIQKRGV